MEINSFWCHIYLECDLEQEGGSVNSVLRMERAGTKNKEVCLSDY